MSKLNIPSRRAGRISATPVIKKAKHLKKLGVAPAKVKLPTKGTSAVDPLFNGTLFFVQVQFTIHSQNDTVNSISDADLATAVKYATQAAVPISQYASQYGVNKVDVRQSVIQFPVTLNNPAYSDTDLQGWVD